MLSRETILVLAPYGQDASLLCDALNLQGFSARSVDTIREVCEAATCVGAIIITSEALKSAHSHSLKQCLASQPPWSDVPVILLAHNLGGVSFSTLTHELGNVTILDRPIDSKSLITVVQTALRARRKQYEVRDLLEANERQQRERAILLESERAARTAAEELGRLKDEFLAVLSHELRTPLNAILGWAQLLKRRKHDIDEGICIIERNAKVQGTLIEDLLDMSKITSGKFQLHREPVSLERIVSDSVAAVRQVAESKQIAIEETSENITRSVNGDAERIQQILLNLLTNAIKFTPDLGTIQIRTKEEHSMGVVSIKDSGRGIEARFMPYLFDRFRQADSSTTRKYGGLGLGLAIVKHLTEMHGGTVQAESEGRGKGSCFTLRLPLHDSAPTTLSVEDETNDAFLERYIFTGMKILIVDDSPDALHLLEMLLTERDATVYSAKSGSEAVTFAHANPPHLIISDIGMPEMDGYALVAELQKFSLTRSIPVIAFSAFARVQDRERALKAGFSGYLTKPIDPHHLVVCVAKILQAGTLERTVLQPDGLKAINEW